VLPAAMLRVGDEMLVLVLALALTLALVLLERLELGPRLALLDGLRSRLGLRAAAAAAAAAPTPPRPDPPMQSWRDRFTQVGAMSPILDSEEKDVDDVTELDDMGEDMGTDMGLGVGAAAPPRPPDDNDDEKAAATAVSPSDAVRILLVRLLLALVRLKLMLLTSSSNPGWAGDGAAELGALSDVPNTFCGVLFEEDDVEGWLGW